MLGVYSGCARNMLGEDVERVRVFFVGVPLGAYFTRNGHRRDICKSFTSRLYTKGWPTKSQSWLYFTGFISRLRRLYLRRVVPIEMETWNGVPPFEMGTSNDVATNQMKTWNDVPLLKMRVSNKVPPLQMGIWNEVPPFEVGTSNDVRPFNWGPQMVWRRLKRWLQMTWLPDRDQKNGVAPKRGPHCLK